MEDAKLLRQSELIVYYPFLGNFPICNSTDGDTRDFSVPAGGSYPLKYPGMRAAGSMQTVALSASATRSSTVRL